MTDAINPPCNGSAQLIGDRRSHPDILLRLLEIAREDAHRLPATGAQEGRGIEAEPQEILRRSEAHGMSAEGGDVGGIDPRGPGGVFHGAPDRGDLEAAVDRMSLADRTEKPAETGPPPVDPVAGEPCRSR